MLVHLLNFVSTRFKIDIILFLLKFCLVYYTNISRQDLLNNNNIIKIMHLHWMENVGNNCNLSLFLYVKIKMVFTFS